MSDVAQAMHPTVENQRPRRSIARHGALAWFLIPALAFYTFVVIYPSLRGVALSFTDWDGLSRDISFVGLDQYLRIFRDTAAMAGIRNTILLAIAYTLFQNGIGLLLAKGLHSKLKSRNILRVIVFSPVVVMPVAVAYLWQFILAPNGALNTILEEIGGEGAILDWLGSPRVVLWSIVAVLVWMYSGIAMAIFLAGLESISPELYDAAAMDGASVFQRFRFVELPLLLPAITINSLLSLIGGLKVFDQIIIMTFGGPGSASETMSTLIYKNAFLFSDYGYSVALAVVLSIFAGVLSVLWYRYLNRRDKS